jgi:hypothetical protein
LQRLLRTVVKVTKLRLSSYSKWNGPRLKIRVEGHFLRSAKPKVVLLKLTHYPPLRCCGGVQSVAESLSTLPLVGHTKYEKLPSPATTGSSDVWRCMRCTLSTAQTVDLSPSLLSIFRPWRRAYTSDKITTDAYCSLYLTSSRGYPPLWHVCCYPILLEQCRVPLGFYGAGRWMYRLADTLKMVPARTCRVE